MALVDANIRCTRLEKSLGRHVSLLQIEFLDRFSLFQIRFSSVVCICTQQGVIDDISLHETEKGELLTIIKKTMIKLRRKKFLSISLKSRNKCRNRLWSRLIALCEREREGEQEIMQSKEVSEMLEENIFPLQTFNIYIRNRLK